jgi:DNA polymerase-3 subunit alpha
MEEARHRGIAVLGPCINESAFKFRVNDAGAIRFGLGAMRGVGEGAVEAIVAGRTVGTGDKTVIYASLFDFARRVSPKDVNKRVYEALALGGGFDGFQDMHRAQFFAEDEKGRTVIEMAARYGAAHQDAESSAQASLFGGTEEVDMPEPPIPLCAPWDPLDALSREKEVVGVYISGHPLDKFRFEMKHLCSPAEEGLQALNNMPRLRGRELRFAGHIVEAAHRISKAGKPFGSFTLEDYHHSERFMLFGEDYLKMKDYLVEGWFVFVRGSVEERRFPRDSGELEFKVRDIELLADVREKMVSRIHLQLNVPALDDTLCDAIIALPERHPGSVGLSVELHGVKPAIPMTSRSKRVAISDDFIAELERLVAGGAVKYKFDFQR